jgi:hypothetical protein
MDAEIIRLEKVLHEYSITMCPLIQRPYVWGKDEVNQLISDILMWITDPKNEGKAYYLGQIMVKEMSNDKLDGITRNLIYEGQQRITTGSMLELALLSFYQENPNLKHRDFDLNSLITALTINGDFNNPKLILTERDREEYNNLLKGKIGNGQLSAMFQIIKKQINRKNHLQLVRGLSMVDVARIKLAPDENAEVIFNSMNSTGKPLSKLDQLRGVCLLNFDLEQQKQFFENKWKPIEEVFRKYIKDDTQFINGWAMLNTSIKLEYLSKQSLTSLRSFEGSGAIDTIYDYAMWLKNTIESSNQAEGNHLIQMLLDMKYPLGIIGVGMINELTENYQITLHEREILLKLFESYCVRAWICKSKGPAKVPGLVDKIAKYYKNGSSNMFRDLSRLFSGTLNAKFCDIPSNSVIQEVLLSKDWNRDNPKLMLCMLENKLNPRSGDLSNMTLEHICATKGISLNKGDVDLKNTIGNFSLLPRSLNSKLSNLDFKTKKTMKNGFDESTLLIDEYLKEHEEFGEDQITERTILLSDDICKIWPEYNAIMQEV